MSIDVNAARDFIRVNARVLEARLAEFYLDGDLDAGRQAVVALEAYRNADNGFGHGLEADSATSASQPLAADFAFMVLDDLVQSEVSLVPYVLETAIPTLDYLGRVADESGGLSIVFPSVTDAPHADHWDNGPFPPDLNPTAGIAGRARSFGLTHPWLDAAVGFCEQAIETDGVDDAHAALCVLRFLESADDAEKEGSASRLAIDELGARLPQLRYFHPMPDEGYGLTPLDFAPRGDSPRRRFFTPEMIDAHLDVLASDQQADGGWPISWESSGPGATLAWRGVRTLGALRTLRSYGRI